MNMNMPSFAGKLSPTATNMIRMDHTHVMATFHQYEIDSSPRTKQGLANTICLALEIHAQLEEEIFYPALKALDSSNPAIQKAVPEHNEMKRLIAKLRGMQPTEAGYDDTLFELMRDVMHHVADEETILLPEAERLMADRLGDLGALHPTWTHGSLVQRSLSGVTRAELVRHGFAVLGRPPAAVPMVNPARFASLA